MGISIGRIEREFILTSITDKHIPIYLHGQKSRQQGLVEVFDDKTVTMKSTLETWDGFEVGHKIRVFFNYYGHTMTFDSKCESVENDTITVQYPATIVKNLERKYERVAPPEGIELSFVFKGTKVALEFPKSEEYEPVNKPEFSEDFEINNISELINVFRGKLDILVSENKIVMFRDKMPESFEERLVARFGRSLFLPTTEMGFPDEEPLTECRVITRDMMYAMFKDIGVQDHNLPVKLAIYLKNKYEDGINSEVYCPILYHEYAIGYIYIANKGNRRNQINEDLLDFLCQFAKVLSYSLKLHGYFKGNQPEELSFDATVVDISASGLLFVHSSRDLSENLVLYSDFTLILKVGPRTIKITSRLMRKFNEAGLSYYGVLFLEIEPEDFRFLFDFVYGRQFSREDAEKWEGGAEPPEVKLFKE